MRKWRKKWFRKIVSVFVSAVLVAGMVFAEMEAEVCAAEGEHTHNGITYEAWTRTDSLPTAPGNYYLTEDVTLFESWEVPSGTTNLCLNGKTIRQAGEIIDVHREVYVFWIQESRRLNLYDCVGGGKLTGAKGSCVYNDGTFYMYGGEISGNAGKYNSGSVYNLRNFYMYGGKICGNTSERGSGGVENWRVFHMYGGEISGNTGWGVRNAAPNGIPATMVVGGSAVISGNIGKDGVEKNLYVGGYVLDDGWKLIIDKGIPLSGTARIGITINDRQPTEEAPIALTDGNDHDYSRYFYSDNEEYAVTDSPDHVLLLGVKHEHTQDEELWSYDVDSHWKECSKCGEKYDEAAHTFGEWLTDREATETEDGEKHRDCGVCGFQEKEPIPAMKPTVPPTKVPTPLPTEKPGVTPKPVVTEKPGVTPEPIATEKPGVTPEPVATEKPGSTTKPVATEKPDSTPKPVATEKPGATLKPVTTEKPSISPKPAATKRPTATPELVATEQPGETQKPPATEQPGVPSELPVTKQPSAAPNPVVTLKPEETEQPPATKNPMVTEKPAATVRPGRIRLKVEVKGNAPGTRVSTSAEQVADMILTAEDWKKLEDGQDINMYVVVTDISNRVSDADRVLAEAASAGYVSGQYVDISLYKEVGSERTRITGPLAGNISLTIVVPDRLKNTESTKKREFAVTRVHNGEAAILLDQDSGADTVTVDTDCFSTYGIVYKDTENKTGSGRETGGSRTGSKAGGDKQNDSAGTGRSGDGEPKTGDGTAFEPAATIAMISGLSYVLLYFWERRRGMTEETKKQITTRIIRWARKGGCLRKGIAIAVIFVFLVYYHSIGKETNEEWKHAI